MNPPRSSARTPGSSEIVTRTPRPSSVQAVQPVSISWDDEGTVAGAPRMPMSSPTVCSSIADWGTIRGSEFSPRISLADVMLMTGRSTGWSPEASSSVMT